MNSYQAFAHVQLPNFDAFLKRQLAADSVNTRLTESMMYSVMAGGKRLRPLLCLAVLADLGVTDFQNYFMVAGSLELVHTYSLIHDDLPAMDNDDLRRGKPTNHKAFDEATAILAGDGLQALAFDWLTQAKLPSETIVQLVQILANAAGPKEMVAGQVADMQGEQLTYDLPALRKLHSQKTGAMLIAAIQMGAVAAGCSAAAAAQLVTFAAHFGLAFQIEDDILDLTSTVEQLGKAVHQDAKENKNTFPAILGLSGAKEALKTEVQAARQSIDAQTFPLVISFLQYFER